MQDAASKMTLGQVSEVLFLVLIPFFFARLGVKKMLLIGMVAWTLRYVLFAYGNNGSLVSLLYAGIILHGICFDFFFVTGQIYVDKKSTAAIRGQAQGFFVFVTYGVGMLIGAQVAGNVYNRFLGGSPSLALEQWRSFWILPSVFALVILVFFTLAFNDRETEVKPSVSAVPPSPKARAGAPTTART
jgi:MFS family permease